MIAIDTASDAIPRCEYTNPNRPAVEQIRTSIARVEDTPNPTAAPLIVAITGVGNSNKSSTTEFGTPPDEVGAGASRPTLEV
jgi:hypothetical protein